jgi:hypothetical protein
MGGTWSQEGTSPARGELTFESRRRPNPPPPLEMKLCNMKDIVVNCDPNIGDCYDELRVPLEQEFCDNTFLKVTDLETSVPVKDASVQIKMKTGNTTQVVSNHLVCPEDRSIREECNIPPVEARAGKAVPVEVNCNPDHCQ